MVCAMTGTFHLSGVLFLRSRLNSPWPCDRSVDPPWHCALSTFISGMPGWLVKSCALHHTPFQTAAFSAFPCPPVTESLLASCFLTSRLHKRQLYSPAQPSTQIRKDA